MRSELEKSEIADWSRKTAAKQLMEMALREKQETELLRKNFRGVFGEELEECRFGIIAVYGKRKKTSVAKFRKIQGHPLHQQNGTDQHSAAGGVSVGERYGISDLE